MILFRSEQTDDIYGPNAPQIVSVSQATTTDVSGNKSSILVFGVVQSPTTGSKPIVSFNLYRSLVPTGPFTTLVASAPLDDFLLVTHLYDQSPTFGQQAWYVATAIDSYGEESATGKPVNYTASLATLNIAPGSIPPSAFGPYPVLGSDVFLDPTSGEAVIGPNGDLLTVNGLECLAQDLRIRILTEVGELPMHPDYGFSKSKVIGSGQAKPQVQAQILRADIMDLLAKEPRVYRVLNVQINQSDSYSWIIGYDIMAINVEDVLHLNMVAPFYRQAVT